MTSFIKRLVIISRPLFCFPISSIFVGGWLLSGQGWTISTTLFLLFNLMPMGIIVFGINDISDRESDSLNSRKGNAQGAVLAAREVGNVQKSIVVVSLAYLAYSFLSKYYLAGCFIAGIILFGLLYSVRPTRLKSVPFLDSLSNGFGVLCVFLIGYYSSYKGLDLGTPPWRTSLLVVLTVAAIHSLTTLFDIDVDRAAGDTTTGTTLGVRSTIVLAFAVFCICSFLASPPNIFVSAYYLLCCLFCLAMYLKPTPSYLHKFTFATILMAPLVAAGVAIYGI